MQLLNNIMVNKFKDGLIYAEFVSKKKQLCVALGLLEPTVER